MFKSVVKVCGSTVKLQLILAVLSTVEVGGIRGVAVKCLDITKNSDCEGSLLSCNQGSLGISISLIEILW